VPRVSKAHALNAQGRLKKGCKYGSDRRPLCPTKPTRKAKAFCKLVMIHGVRRKVCWANTTASGIVANDKPRRKKK
jgi:hypothetical protein